MPAFSWAVGDGAKYSSPLFMFGGDGGGAAGDDGEKRIDAGIR